MQMKKKNLGLFVLPMLLIARPDSAG